MKHKAEEKKAAAAAGTGTGTGTGIAVVPAGRDNGQRDPQGSATFTH